MDDLGGALDEVAASTGFAGVVRVDMPGGQSIVRAYGMAHRGCLIPNEVNTRFGIASGTKGMTALVVCSVIEDGHIELATTARSLLGELLPAIDDGVTVEHLLAHRSGIGDYLDEDAMGSAVDYVMPIPVHRLSATADYLAVLDGHPQQFEPGSRFSYNNGGFVVLALIAERVTGIAFTDLVRDRVCRPAGMTDTAFLRSDEPAARVALGYLDGESLRTNVLHLPVRGSGDGGMYTTAADISALWAAMYAGRIVSREWVAELTRPRSDAPAHEARYGLGFWLRPTGDSVVLTGSDAGVSFQSVHDENLGRTYTVLSNTTGGAWPICRRLRDLVDL